MAIVTPGIMYLQPMQCVSCGAVVLNEENEKTTIVVNARGLPINSDTSEYSVKGICPKCGREYEVEKQGMYFRFRNKTHELCPTLKLQEDKEIGFGVEI